jgi:hypothetical protein
LRGDTSTAPVWVLLLVFVAVVLSDSGCASRVETAETAADSTVVYAAKDPQDIETTITLCSKVSKKTGRRIGVSRVFDIVDGKRIRAFVDLENRFALGPRQLSFHLVWLNPEKRTVYKKRYDMAPDDSTTNLSSSIKLSSKRTPGNYTFQVYLFRELIAEKSFELRAAG